MRTTTRTTMVSKPNMSVHPISADACVERMDSLALPAGDPPAAVAPTCGWPRPRTWRLHPAGPPAVPSARSSGNPAAPRSQVRTFSPSSGTK